METEIKTIIDTQEVENTNEVVETATETTEQVAEICESAEESVEDTEKSTETEETKTETAKVEPLPEQKPFLLNPYERVILEEMERRATDNPALAEGLKDKGKSIQECFAFVSNRARKMATDTCAMVEYEVVYSWAQFYYTQSREVISLELKPKTTYTPPKPNTATTTAKTETKKKEGKKAEKKAETKKEQKSAEKTEEVKGGDGKVYKITELALF